MIKINITAVFAPLALALAACSPAKEPGPSADGVDLRGATMGGDFTLTSSAGKKVSWADFKGKYRILYFGYTFCPDICPTDVGRFSAGLKIFENEHPDLAAKVQPIFITVDPARDTPEKIGEFISNFHPRLIGLTGSEDEIAKVSAKFAASAVKEEANETGSYLVTHSTLTYLFGPSGEPLGTLPTDKGPEAIAKELAGWVR